MKGRLVHFAIHCFCFHLHSTRYQHPLLPSAHTQTTYNRDNRKEVMALCASHRQLFLEILAIVDSLHDSMHTLLAPLHAQQPPPPPPATTSVIATGHGSVPRRRRPWEAHGVFPPAKAPRYGPLRRPAHASAAANRRPGLRIRTPPPASSAEDAFSST